MDEFRRKAAVPPSRPALLGTVVLLIIGFMLLIGLVFVFSIVSPSLLGKCVAVVEIDSELSTAGTQQTLFSKGTPGSEEIASSIRSLDEREDVGALLLVVDSPGGSAVASREIYDAVTQLKKPKVAYIHEVGASGGYHIVSPADYIIASPDALTGSIGAIAIFGSVQGFLDRLGIETYVVKSGEMKDTGYPLRNATPEKVALVEAIVNESFYSFKMDIVRQRGNRLDSRLFEEILDGRVLTGRQAVKVGLVDQTGNRKDALVKAAGLAKLSYKNANDIRVCTVKSTQQEGTFLVSMQGMLRSIREATGSPRLLFR